MEQTPASTIPHTTSKIPDSPPQKSKTSDSQPQKGKPPDPPSQRITTTTTPAARTKIIRIDPPGSLAAEASTYPRPHRLRRQSHSLSPSTVTTPPTTTPNLTQATSTGPSSNTIDPTTPTEAKADFTTCMHIRERVFVQEQNVPLENELDDEDGKSVHWILFVWSEGCKERREIEARREGSEDCREGSEVETRREGSVENRVSGEGPREDNDDLSERSGEAKDHTPPDERASPSRWKPAGTIRLVPPPHPPEPVDLHELSPSTTANNAKEVYVKLGRLAILPEFRGLGLGRELLESSLKWAAEHPTYFSESADTTIDSCGHDIHAPANTNTTTTTSTGSEHSNLSSAELQHEGGHSNPTCSSSCLDTQPAPAARQPKLNTSTDRDKDTSRCKTWNGLLLAHAQEHLADMYERWGFWRDENSYTWEEEGIMHVGVWRRVRVRS
ncbi:MAG: hypothetical protein M1831_001080 [Alyxoria varia]|nr:MAG: hypothetical protein M1831_001080 [Alyxoria varia]